jgi:hypothetical protein
MIGLLLLVVGSAALVVGLLLLRRTGSAYRVGRLLTAAPEASLDEIVALARSDERRYVRAHGRIASDEEFPDEQGRPLVYRRRRLQRREAQGRWADLDDERLAVPFGIKDRQAFVRIDVDALGDGLVVVPRQAVGTAGELPPDLIARLPPMPPSTPVRLRVDQLSSVEHATVTGVPTLAPDGDPQLTAGLGRPLVVTSLDHDAAMRILAGDQRRTVVAAAACLVGGLGALAVGIVAMLVRI